MIGENKKNFLEFVLVIIKDATRNYLLQNTNTKSKYK